MEDAHRDEIRELRARFWSDRDPEGRVFAPLADAYRRAGDLDEAAEIVEEGTERLPEFAPGHLVRARVLRDRGRTEEALGALRQVLDLDPGNVEALRHAALLAEESGQTGDALRWLQRLARAEPETDGLRERIRELKRRHFGLDEEAEDAEDAEETEAEDAPEVEAPAMEAEEEPPSEEPAWVEEHQEEAEEEAEEEAREEAEEEADDDEEAEVYTRTMAELYVRQGHLERATEVYRHLVEQRPDEEELRTRLEALEAGEIETAPEPAGAPREARGEDAEREPEPSPAPDASVPVASDEEMEALAQEWADGPESTGELSTPFAWGDEGSPDAGSANGPSIAAYFDRLLEWTPEAAEPEDEAGEPEVVPVESLAPDAGPQESEEP